jgi:hypothetical protein
MALNELHRWPSIVRILKYRRLQRAEDKEYSKNFGQELVNGRMED